MGTGDKPIAHSGTESTTDMAINNITNDTDYSIYKDIKTGTVRREFISKQEFEKFARSINEMNLQRIKDKNEQDKKIAKLERDVVYLMQFAPMKEV